MPTWTFLPRFRASSPSTTPSAADNRILYATIRKLSGLLRILYSPLIKVIVDEINFIVDEDNFIVDEIIVTHDDFNFAHDDFVFLQIYLIL